MPVLYAVFIYMGVAPLFELEFFHRILLLLMPKSCLPDLMYLRHVSLRRVHLFTILQLACLVALFLFKLNKTISITFPLMVLSLVFIRFALRYLFTQKELSYLDDLLPGDVGEHVIGGGGGGGGGSHNDHRSPETKPQTSATRNRRKKNMSVREVDEEKSIGVGGAALLQKKKDEPPSSQQQNPV
jgi:hypothetical protein